MSGVVFWLSLSDYSLAQSVDSQTLLQNMQQASRMLNYELAFVNIDPQQGVESMRYRHAQINHQQVSQLLQMDGPRREVVQRGKEISYFDPSVEPFTLPGDYIVDAIPSLIYANFKRLASYYNFISMGRTRIADSLCEVIRVVSKDGTRYSYLVWMDVKTNLPLRVDLLGRDGETLEQFRVIDYTISKQPDLLLYKLQSAVLPPQLAAPVAKKQIFNWQPGWLPLGFKEMSSSRRQIPGIDEPIESRLYSDGLFSFSLNVNPVSRLSSNQTLHTGRRTVISQINNHVEITVVGELPPPTIKRILNSIKFGAVH